MNGLGQHREVAEREGVNWVSNISGLYWLTSRFLITVLYRIFCILANVLSDLAAIWFESLKRIRTDHPRGNDAANHEISRFPFKERPHMPRSATTPGRPGTRVSVPFRVAFHSVKMSAPGMRSFSRFDSLAYALPCQRFADTLTCA